MNDRAEAEGVAREVVRDQWSLGSAQPPLPVDPIFIARQLGINVLETPLAGDVAGFLVKEAGSDMPTIYLNANDHRNRQRFTCAHEIGHFKRRQRSADPADSYNYVDRRDALAGRGSNPSEIWANQFAAELLMPAEAVKRMRGYVSWERLAVEFGVSQDALTNRIANIAWD